MTPVARSSSRAWAVFVPLTVVLIESSPFLASPLAADPPLTGVIRSGQSGPWSASATWEGGKVPGAGARVLIRQGHRVVDDLQTYQVIRAEVDPENRFAPPVCTGYDGR